MHQRKKQKQKNESADIDQLEEWGTFAKRAFTNPPTRRVGKRLILEGEIPGRILDNKPWVYVIRYALNEKVKKDRQDPIIDAAMELLE